MDLKRVGKSIRTIFVKEDGTRFLGRLITPSLSQAKSNFYLQPRRILIVDFKQNIQPGECFKFEDGKWGLVTENADGYFDKPMNRTYGVVLMDKEADWERRISEVDPVTSLEKTTGYENLGKLKYNNDFQKYEVDTLQLSNPVRNFITGKEVKPFDRIGGSLQIQNVQKILGIYIAQVKGTLE